MIFVTFSSKTDIFYYRDTIVSRLLLWFVVVCVHHLCMVKQTKNIFKKPATHKSYFRKKC